MSRVIMRAAPRPSVTLAAVAAVPLEACAHASVEPSLSPRHARDAEIVLAHTPAIPELTLGGSRQIPGHGCLGLPATKG